MINLKSEEADIFFHLHVFVASFSYSCLFVSFVPEIQSILKHLKIVNGRNKMIVL